MYYSRKHLESKPNLAGAVKADLPEDTFMVSHKVANSLLHHLAPLTNEKVKLDEGNENQPDANRDCKKRWKFFKNRTEQEKKKSKKKYRSILKSGKYKVLFSNAAKTHKMTLMKK